MESNNYIVAPIQKRFFAFLLDVFFVYLVRFFYVHLSLYYWIGKEISVFVDKYKLLFGNFDMNRATSIEIMFFLRSNLFKQLVLFVIGLFIISMIYDTVFLLTKWSATLGQKIMGIYVASKNGERIKWYQAVIRGIMTNIPWVFLFFIMISQKLGTYNVQIIDQQTFIISILIFLTWYDVAFFTKNKIVFHDLVTSTVVIIKDKDNYIENSGGLWSVLFPNFKDMYKGLKEHTAKQIEYAKELKKKYKEEKEARKKESEKKAK